MLIDPVNRLSRMHLRQAVDHWFDTTFAAPHDLDLPVLGVRLTEADLFAPI